MKKISTPLFCVLFVAGIAFSQFANAQTTTSTNQTNQFERGPSGMIRCATPPPPPEWDAWFNAQVEEFKKGLETGKMTVTNYTIPVVIHVIYGTEAVGTYPNLSQAQLNSQIVVLNQDYSGTGYNTSTYPATAYTHWATAQALPAANKDANGRVAIANTGIQFCLATKDPNGVTLPEPGIDRVSYTAKGWSNPNSASYNSTTTFMNYIDGTIKPGTIWNPAKYLNMWVTDENTSVGLLGYATFPAGTTLSGISGPGTSTTDGFWAVANAFGSKNICASGTYDPTYCYGRTCTHEIGHYLGLRHTWGDGTCLTDYCNDTPTETAANYANCPQVYPFHSGTCTSPSNSPDGEMTMNFMDYTNDACMYMFSVDQTSRIQTCMQTGTYRTGLNASAALLCTTGILENNLSNNISIYPNPSSGDIFMNVNSTTISSADITIFNAIGDIVLQKRVPISSGSAVKFEMINHPDGMYLIQMKTAEGTITKKVILNR